jgi:hypothetical protein
MKCTILLSPTVKPAPANWLASVKITRCGCLYIGTILLKDRKLQWKYQNCNSLKISLKLKYLTWLPNFQENPKKKLMFPVKFQDDGNPILNQILLHI